jgi:small subunit ribosomal protein S5
LKTEANKILKKSKLDDNDVSRLFELYIQSEEMKDFTHDFNELRILFGAENPDDPFSWSSFIQDDHYEDAKFDEPLKAINAEERQQAIDRGKLKARVPLVYTPPPIMPDPAFEDMDDDLMDDNSKYYKTGANDNIEDNNLIDDMDNLSETQTFKEDDEFHAQTYEESKEISNRSTQSDVAEEEKSKLSPVNLTDSLGHVWSGTILDTDTVQKTMPGNRVMSHRALVVIGNLRGVGGLGTAKGKSVDEAVSAAFRDALRNLTFIDLYDNFGLAHDLYGKHNACHAYIRATPRARLMVASPFAQSILESFGISSCSCKLVGRRNPYSMARAIFKALEKHENIDEFAKARGKRYLTLRWAYENRM